MGTCSPMRGFGARLRGGLGVRQARSFRDCHPVAPWVYAKKAAAEPSSSTTLPHNAPGSCSGAESVPCHYAWGLACFGLCSRPSSARSCSRLLHRLVVHSYSLVPLNHAVLCNLNRATPANLRCTWSCVEREQKRWLPQIAGFQLLPSMPESSPVSLLMACRFSVQGFGNVRVGYGMLGVCVCGVHRPQLCILVAER